MMAHDMLARVAPEFAINEADARMLAVKFCALARHYSVFSDVDPKTRDMRLFLAAIAMMEGPRIYRVVTRRSAAKETAKAQRAAMTGGLGPQAPGGTIIDLDGTRRP